MSKAIIDWDGNSLCMNITVRVGSERSHKLHNNAELT